MLSEEIKEKRLFKFTASMAPVIMAGDENPQMLQETYERAVGLLPDIEPTWPMRLGSFLEDFIIDYHQEKTGEPLIERGTFIAHPTREDVSATLDCYRASERRVIDAKVTGHWRTIEDIVRWYTPQIVVQQRCRDALSGSLLIMHGTAEPREYPIFFDAAYETELWERIDDFQRRMRTLTPPIPQPKMVPPDEWRSISLDDLSREHWPNWAFKLTEELRDWDANKDGADQFAKATKAVKGILPDDVKLLEYGGMQVKRSTNSALTIRRA